MLSLLLYLSLCIPLVYVLWLDSYAGAANI